MVSLCCFVCVCVSVGRRQASARIARPSDRTSVCPATSASGGARCARTQPRTQSPPFCCTMPPLCRRPFVAQCRPCAAPPRCRSPPSLAAMARKEGIFVVGTRAPRWLLCACTTKIPSFRGYCAVSPPRPFVRWQPCCYYSCRRSGAQSCAKAHPGASDIKRRKCESCFREWRSQRDDATLSTAPPSHLFECKAKRRKCESCFREWRAGSCCCAAIWWLVLSSRPTPKRRTQKHLPSVPALVLSAFDTHFFCTPLTLPFGQRWCSGVGLVVVLLAEVLMLLSAFRLGGADTSLVALT